MNNSNFIKKTDICAICYRFICYIELKLQHLQYPLYNLNHFPLFKFPTIIREKVFNFT